LVLKTAKIASIPKEDERVRLLMTIPGINYITALTIVSEIVDIRRFSTPWKLLGYARTSAAATIASMFNRHTISFKLQRMISIRYPVPLLVECIVGQEARSIKKGDNIPSLKGPCHVIKNESNSRESSIFGPLILSCLELFGTIHSIG
jgi:hypothetical protein